MTAVSEQTAAVEQVTYTWTGPPGVVWIQRPPLIIFLMMLLCVGMLGAVIGLAISDATREVAVRNNPVEFSESEKAAAYLSQETSPVVMTLRILPRDEYRARHPGTDAIAYTHRAPCQIEIPAGWKILAQPKTGTAVWARSYDGDVLAHEILHCLRGGWHQ